MCLYLQQAVLQLIEQRMPPIIQIIHVICLSNRCCCLHDILQCLSAISQNSNCCYAYSVTAGEDKSHAAHALRQSCDAPCDDARGSSMRHPLYAPCRS